MKFKMKKNKKDNYNLVFHAPKIRRGQDNPSILRITLTDQFTKIDFGHVANDYYYKGGWIRIHKDTSIRVKETGECYKLTKADNIPITPEQHHFESEKDWQFFSLYFEPLPKVDCTFDLIEEDPQDPNDFNYWGVNLGLENASKVIQ